MPIEPGKTYLLTRRCLGRHRWLTPGSDLNQLFLYLFAVGAKRFGFEVHALTIMSTHYHAVVTDPEGVVPAFEQWLHSLLARSVNRLRGRTDTFWDGRSGVRQEIVDVAALEDALVYVWNNPTAAGLVRRGKRWPGVRTRPHDMLAAVGSKKPITVVRPEWFFAGSGRLPGSVTLAFSVPEQLLDEEARRVREEEEAEAEAARGRGGAETGEARGADSTVGERPSPGPSVGALHAGWLKRLAGRVVAKFNDLVREAEDEVAERLAAEGRSFVGAEAILGQSPEEQSTQPEKHGAKLTRIPLFLTSSREARAELLEKLADWRGRYRTARLALVAYLGKVSRGGAVDLGFFEDEEELKVPWFPWGTYQLRVTLSVPCHPPPA